MPIGVCDAVVSPGVRCCNLDCQVLIQVHGFTESCSAADRYSGSLDPLKGHGPAVVPCQLNFQ